MSETRQTLHELVERIPDAEIPIAERFLSLLSRESIGPQFAESIRRGIVQAAAGDTTVCRDFRDMVEKLLDKA